MNRLRLTRSISLTFASLFISVAAQAGTINVNVTADENIANANCSLREAIQAHENQANFNGCTGVTAGANTIMFLAGGSGTHTVTSLLPFVTDAAVKGALSIDGSGQAVVVSCNGSSRIFTAESNASLSLSNLAISNCTAAGGGIAITSNSGDVSLVNVTVTNVHSNSGGAGGVINLTNGSLTVTNCNFDSNGTGDSAPAVNGDGGVMYLSNIDPPNFVSMTNATFTRNTAENSGGAIYITSNPATGHAITLTNCIFGGVLLGNSAGGSGAEIGGGAIWADTGDTAAHVFLITNGQFISNTAPAGAGGAILLPFQSRLAYATAVTPSAGGIFASHFEGNSAGGPAGIDGAGGAIYSRGHLTVVQSSFRNNASTNSSGGAIATNAPSGYVTTLGNVTLNANTAAQNGGGIAKININDTLSLINTTLAGNTANAMVTTLGGGLFNAGAAANVLVRNSILSGNLGTGGNCTGVSNVTNQGNNLQFNPDTGCGVVAMTTGNPALAAASIFAGPNLFVWTMALGGGSPALNGGDNAICAAGPILNFDATGRPGIRPQTSPNCDIGAFESGTVPVELRSSAHNSSRSHGSGVLGIVRSGAQPHINPRASALLFF